MNSSHWLEKTYEYLPFVGGQEKTYVAQSCQGGGLGTPDPVCGCCMVYNNPKLALTTVHH